MEAQSPKYVLTFAADRRHIANPATPGRTHCRLQALYGSVDEGQRVCKVCEAKALLVQ